MGEPKTNRDEKSKGTNGDFRPRLYASDKSENKLKTAQQR